MTSCLTMPFATFSGLLRTLGWMASTVKANRSLCMFKVLLRMLGSVAPEAWVRVT